MPNTFRWKLVGAFGSLYLIWGSTYLAIRFALETLPPFIMTGSRFVVAGILLYSWARLRGNPSPTLEQWPPAILIGALLLLLGNGGVVWAEQSLSSGMTALIIATQPLFLALFDWMRPGGKRPSWLVATGLILGFCGTGFLLAPWSPSTTFSWLGTASALLASVAWAVGSLYALRANQPSSPLISTGQQLFCGGMWLLLAGLLNREWHAINLTNVSLRSWIALLYLLVFSSFVAFSAYLWLLRTTSLARFDLRLCEPCSRSLPGMVGGGRGCDASNAPRDGLNPSCGLSDPQSTNRRRFAPFISNYGSSPPHARRSLHLEIVRSF